VMEAKKRPDHRGCSAMLCKRLVRLLSSSFPSKHQHASHLSVFPSGGFHCIIVCLSSASSASHLPAYFLVHTYIYTPTHSTMSARTVFNRALLAKSAARSLRPTSSLLAASFRPLTTTTIAATNTFSNRTSNTNNHTAHSRQYSSNMSSGVHNLTS
jgi:hypothetical protein